MRGAKDFAADHIPGGRHLPLDELPQRLDELPHYRQLVTYCSMRHLGQSRSERAAALLRERGVDAHVLAHGLPAREVALVEHGAIEHQEGQQ
jgi:rhodanese-related sulfurtransferase